MIEMLKDEKEITEARILEATQLITYGVFEPVHRADVGNHQIIDTKEILVQKFNSVGDFVKYKSRVVAKGYVEELPYGFDTSSPTARLESLFVILNIANYENLEIETIDVRAAFFLESEMTREDVFVSFGKDIASALVTAQISLKQYLEEDGTLVGRLKKALYGLKEACKAWHDKVSKVLIEFGFTRCKHDAAVFVKQGKKGLHIIALHVDDMLHVGHKEDRNDLKAYLRKTFKDITVEEDVKLVQYVGLAMQRDFDKHTIFVSQPGYVDKILKESGLQAEDFSDLPYDGNLFTVAADSKKIDHPTVFRSALMKLMFITRTRADLKLVLSFLTTIMQEPTEEDERKLIKVLRYLNKTKHMGTLITKTNLKLTASCDASFNSYLDAKGQNGAVTWLGEGEGEGAPIHVSTKKQMITAKSSTEAELMALDAVIEELLWTRGIMEDLGYKQDVTEVEQDNKSCMILAQRGPGRGGRSKSINVKFFWINEQIENKIIKLKYICRIR